MIHTVLQLQIVEESQTDRTHGQPTRSTALKHISNAHKFFSTTVIRASSSHNQDDDDNPKARFAACRLRSMPATAELTYAYFP